MKKVYYEKVGRRYKPVAEYDSNYLDSFPKGNHLVMVYPGGTSRRFNIEPNYAAMIAAGRVAEDAVTSAISKSMELRPQKTPLTERQRELWRELAESFKQEDYPLIRPAAADAGQAAVQAMIAEANKLMRNPNVREAYAAFQITCALVGKNNGS